jgi:DDE domain
MVCKARLSCRSPPRLSRWRTTWPEKASTGCSAAQHRECGLGAEPARARPADEHLGGGDRPDPALSELHRRHRRDEHAQLDLELFGLGAGGQYPLGGHPQRPHGGAVLHRIAGHGHQRSAGASLLPGAGTLALAVTPRSGEAVCMRTRRSRPGAVPRSAFAGFRFPPDVIVLAVRWYLRFGLSYPDVEELLAERGIEVDHVTIYCWRQRFTPLHVEAARPCRHSVGNRWQVDEAYVKVAGRWRYVYRAIDQFGQAIDISLLSRCQPDAWACDPPASVRLRSRSRSGRHAHRTG